MVTSSYIIVSPTKPSSGLFRHADRISLFAVTWIYPHSFRFVKFCCVNVQELYHTTGPINRNKTSPNKAIFYGISCVFFTSQSEIRAILTCGPEGMTSHEANMVIMKILKDYDLDRDGRISYAGKRWVCLLCVRVVTPLVKVKYGQLDTQRSIIPRHCILN